ncbi:hypothetical protein RR48_07727 [Papilio machaon]|uniref:Uncharacterized protein n=1 Tax=Papilio machaon TaxID=76193 RepID=A0A194R4D8_PAPMA|nr:hypothetical protein RR48_07727 [Papilio machaon]
MVFTIRYPLCWIRGITRLNKIRNEFEAASVCAKSPTRCRRISCDGHITRRPMDYVNNLGLQHSLPSRRSRGRPTIRSKNVVLKIMSAYQVSDDVEDRAKWKRLIRKANPTNF